MRNYDLSRPADLLEVQLKLRGSLDERLVVWWIKATQYAVVDNNLTPLYRLLNASFQRFSRISDSRYSIRMLELGYMTDTENGRLLTEFINPFTQQRGDVPSPVFGPNQVYLTTEGLQPPEEFPFGQLSFTGKLGPGFHDDEDTWVSEDTLVEMTSANPAVGDYRYIELVTYRGEWAEVLQPEPLCANAQLSYTTTSNWRPWMMSGETPGHLMSAGFGKKVATTAELPQDFVALARQHHPELIAAPETLLDPQSKPAP